MQLSYILLRLNAFTIGHLDDTLLFWVNFILHLEYWLIKENKILFYGTGHKLCIKTKDTATTLSIRLTEADLIFHNRLALVPEIGSKQRA